MTLHPALARLERGFRRMWEWVRRPFAKTREYRFEGEQANHAQQLAETQTAIAGFEAIQANPDASAEERHWLHHHRVGMEDRLAVFEGKPRLTVEELTERDMIETHLYGAPLPRGRLVARTDGGWKPQGFAALGLLGGAKLWMLFGGLAALAGLWGGVQTMRIDNLKDDLREERAENRQLETEIMEANAIAAHFRDQAAEADLLSQATAANIEAERARRLRAEREARSIRNAMEQARAGNAVDYGFGSVRDDGAATTGPGGSDTAGGDRR